MNSRVACRGARGCCPSAHTAGSWACRARVCTRLVLRQWISPRSVRWRGRASFRGPRRRRASTSSASPPVSRGTSGTARASSTWGRRRTSGGDCSPTRPPTGQPRARKPCAARAGAVPRSARGGRPHARRASAVPAVRGHVRALARVQHTTPVRTGRSRQRSLGNALQATLSKQRSPALRVQGGMRNMGTYDPRPERSQTRLRCVWNERCAGRQAGRQAGRH